MLILSWKWIDLFMDRKFFIFTAIYTWIRYALDDLNFTQFDIIIIAVICIHWIVIWNWLAIIIAITIKFDVSPILGPLNCWQGTSSHVQWDQGICTHTQLMFHKWLTQNMGSLHRRNTQGLFHPCIESSWIASLELEYIYTGRFSRCSHSWNTWIQINEIFENLFS